MKHNKLIALAMSAALTLSLASTALAAGGEAPGYGGHEPSDAEIAANGHTTISIMQAKQDPKNVSFEVPLYVTMAVVDSTAAVSVPTNYSIKNTSTDSGDGKNDAFTIGVTAMYFEKLSTAAGSFNTVATSAAVSAATDLYLTIGGAVMPALSTVVRAQVTLVGSDFMSGAAIKAIAPAATLALPLAGTVKSDTRDNAGAVAQFKVQYTISALDADGKPLGTVYAGDDSYLAGLGDQEPTNP